MKKHLRNLNTPIPAAPASGGPFPCSWWELTDQETPHEKTEGGGERWSMLFRNLETGQMVPSQDLPIGALYACDWGGPAGYDGKSIVCVCPGGHHWYIDSRASNCTMKEDTVHRCWVRHGTIGERIHVDKHGNTCKAGAGSIRIGNPEWHGYLHNHQLSVTS